MELRNYGAPTNLFGLEVKVPKITLNNREVEA